MKPTIQEDDRMTAQASMEQTPGDLDLGFAEVGMINIPQDSSQCVVETTAEKLLYAAQKGNSQWVYRAASGGTPDRDFTTFEWSFAKGQFEKPTRLLAREDGKFLLIGYTGSDPFIRQAAITQFNEEGSPNLVFGTRIFPLPVDPVPPGQGLQTDEPTGCLTADNHVLVGASYQLSDNDGITIDSAGRVYSLDDQGNPDTGFNESGMIEVRFKGPITKILSLSVLPDGRIVVFGIVDRPSQEQSNSRAALACYNRDGTLHKAFGIDGFWENDDYTNFGAMVLDGDKIVIAAVTSINDDGKRYISVQRLLGNATADPSFNGGNTQVVDLDTSFLNIPSIAVQPNRKIVVGGSEDFPAQKLYWLRITEGGVLDVSFGRSGVVREQTGRVNDIIVQRTGNRIIIAADLNSGERPGPKVLGIQS
jgi:uncharacterized delta-60 repeat protein